MEGGGVPTTSRRHNAAYPPEWGGWGTHTTLTYTPASSLVTRYSPFVIPHSVLLAPCVSPCLLLIFVTDPLAYPHHSAHSLNAKCRQPRKAIGTLRPTPQRSCFALRLRPIAPEKRLTRKSVALAPPPTSTFRCPLAGPPSRLRGAASLMYVLYHRVAGLSIPPDRQFLRAALHPGCRIMAGPRWCQRRATAARPLCHRRRSRAADPAARRGRRSVSPPARRVLAAP